MTRFSLTYRDLDKLWLDHRPDAAPAPRLIRWNADLATTLGVQDLEADAARLFSGAALHPDWQPIAQAYAGHQFGGFSPQLGDGRAVLLTEVLDRQGRRFDIALKGSGPTVFSRGGDGRAALGPVLREYLMGEAMAALGVPTSRALAVVTTGAQVWRDGQALPGAVLARVAASHIRIGTFQFLAARGQTAALQRLLDHAIARHHPQAAEAESPALAFFDAVTAAQCRLVAQWMGLGFIHGVMNTDNMTISGETIDYGPCAFMEAYAPGTVFSSIDRQGRYAWANQPHALAWNLARLAETLLPLIDPDQNRAVQIANDRLAAIPDLYRQEWLAVMAAKLGLDPTAPVEPLVEGWLAALDGQDADWTLAHRQLATDDETLVGPLLRDPGPLRDWLPRWRAARAPDFTARMTMANPAVIPRNHLVEQALAAAHQDDLGPFDRLLAALRAPFAPGPDELMLPAPAGFTDRYQTFCGT